MTLKIEICESKKRFNELTEQRGVLNNLVINCFKKNRQRKEKKRKEKKRD